MIPQHGDTGFYLDFGALSKLRLESKEGSDQSKKAAVQQFEALFLQMMLKSMRGAGFGDPLFDSQQMKMSMEMFDKQIAMNIAKNGGLGLSDLIEDQLGFGTTTKQEEKADPAMGLSEYMKNQVPVVPIMEVSKVDEVFSSDLEQTLPVKEITSDTNQHSATVQKSDVSTTFETPAQFVSVLWDQADKVAREKNLNTNGIIAQAALETGWGKHIIRHPDGTSSNNLFGIKADKRWAGDKVTTQTLEFENGVMTQKTATFRSYQSLEESVEDFVAFLESNPRYRDVLQHGKDAQKYVNLLQQAGYATDPDYATKIENIMAGNEFNQALTSLKL